MADATSSTNAAILPRLSLRGRLSGTTPPLSQVIEEQPVRAPEPARDGTDGDHQERRRFGEFRPRRETSESGFMRLSRRGGRRSGGGDGSTSSASLAAPPGQTTPQTSAPPTPTLWQHTQRSASFGGRYGKPPWFAPPSPHHRPRTSAPVSPRTSITSNFTPPAATVPASTPRPPLRRPFTIPPVPPHEPQPPRKFVDPLRQACEVGSLKDTTLGSLNYIYPCPLCTRTRWEECTCLASTPTREVRLSSSSASTGSSARAVPPPPLDQHPALRPSSPEDNELRVRYVPAQVPLCLIPSRSSAASFTVGNSSVRPPSMHRRGSDAPSLRRTISPEVVTSIGAPATGGSLRGSRPYLPMLQPHEYWRSPSSSNVGLPAGILREGEEKPEPVEEEMTLLAADAERTRALEQLLESKDRKGKMRSMKTSGGGSVAGSFAAPTASTSAAVPEALRVNVDDRSIRTVDAIPASPAIITKPYASMQAGPPPTLVPPPDVTLQNKRGFWVRLKKKLGSTRRRRSM